MEVGLEVDERKKEGRSEMQRYMYENQKTV